MFKSFDEVYIYIYIYTYRMSHFNCSDISKNMEDVGKVVKFEGEHKRIREYYWFNDAVKIRSRSHWWRYPRPNQ